METGCYRSMLGLLVLLSTVETLIQMITCAQVGTNVILLGLATIIYIYILTDFKNAHF